MPSTHLLDFANNLALVFAYGVLEDVLKQLRDERTIVCDKWGLKNLMAQSKHSLDWIDFRLVDKGRDRRNDIAHRGVVLARGECWKYVDAIEKEMLQWGILGPNDFAEE